MHRFERRKYHTCRCPTGIAANKYHDGLTAATNDDGSIANDDGPIADDDGSTTDDGWWDVTGLNDAIWTACR